MPAASHCKRGWSTSSLPPKKNATFVVTHRHTYNMHAFRYLYSQCDNVTTEKTNTQEERTSPYFSLSWGVFSATISAPADTISLSAHILIVFSNTIRKSTLTFLISTHLLQKKLKKSSEDSEDFQHNWCDLF